MTEHPDAKNGEVVIKLCDNLDSLTTKLENEKRKPDPNQGTIAKFTFQIKACEKGLGRIQYKTGILNPV